MRAVGQSGWRRRLDRAARKIRLCLMSRPTPHTETSIPAPSCDSPPTPNSSSALTDSATSCDHARPRPHRSFATCPSPPALDSTRSAIRHHGLVFLRGALCLCLHPSCHHTRPHSTPLHPLLSAHAQSLTTASRKQNCGDVLTKKKLDPHRNQCYGATYTCIDCMVYFEGTSYRAHTVRRSRLSQFLHFFLPAQTLPCLSSLCDTG